MIKMKCNSCGGNLEVEPTDFVKVGEIIVQTCNTFRCPYCLSTFRRNEQFDLAVNIEVHNANMQINKADVVVYTGGGTYIAGDVNLGPGQDFVCRDKITIVQKA